MKLFYASGNPGSASVILQLTIQSTNGPRLVPKGCLSPVQLALADASSPASSLLCRGAGGGHRVGVMLPRSIELYVGILAALKSGATYVPLDPDHPADRVRYILEDCEVKIVVTTSDLLSKHRVASDVIVLD